MQNFIVANEYGSNIEVYRPDNSGEVSVQALNAFFEDTGLTLDQLTAKLQSRTWKLIPGRLINMAKVCTTLRL